MKKIILFVLALSLGGSLWAQVYFQNTMYAFTHYAYNPGAAGVAIMGMEDGPNLTLLGRQQWLGLEGAPRTSFLAFNSPLSSNDNTLGAIGAMLVNDRLGPFSNTWLDVSYAYSFDVGRKVRINIGASGGFRQVAIDGTNWVYNTDNGEDPLIPSGTPSTAVPNLGAGLYITGLDDNNREGKYYIGISGQNLLEPSYDVLFANAIGDESSIPRSLNLMAGYRFDISERMRIQPGVMMQMDNRLPPQVNASVLWSYRPIVLGLNYRFYGESIGAMLGVNINDRTFFGYSYDYVTNSLNSQNDIGSHELIISYTFPGGAQKTGRKVDILTNPGGL